METNSDLEKYCSFDDRFKLVIIQDAKYARACGSSQKYRRVLDPTPILKLVNKNDERGFDSVLYEYQPFLIATATLLEVNPHGRTRISKEIVGSTISNASILRDDKGNLGCFFIFSDLSIVKTGNYKLEFKLFHLMNCIDQSDKSFSAISRTFQVTDAKNFPGLSSPNEILAAFSAQGAIVPIRKFNKD
ncbi:hypothetical protein HDV06_006506 [Boothiomyces sp. JEL0866]|nr:hypothetical protein HDV06_006506 [Boothiomyces sp. JEL0866]